MAYLAAEILIYDEEPTSILIKGRRKRRAVMFPSPVMEKKSVWTYGDYLKLDDGKRYEIIEGELFMVPAPGLEHQRISRELEYRLLQYIKEKGSGELFDAPVDVIFDELSVVQPDIAFVSKENYGILQKKGIQGAPDLVIEIVSPSSLYKDAYQKKDIYEKFQVKEYWIVDPGNRAIQVFTLEGSRYEIFSFASEDEVIKSKVLQGFELKISDIMR